jgi:hypothetical protein
MKIRKLQTKKLYNIGPWFTGQNENVNKLFKIFFAKQEKFDCRLTSKPEAAYSVVFYPSMNEL